MKKKFLSLCGLSTERFLAIWLPQYEFLINEFLIKQCVFPKIQISKIPGCFQNLDFAKYLAN